MATHPKTSKLFLTAGLLLFALSVECLILFGFWGFGGWQEVLWRVVVIAIGSTYLIAAIDIIWMRIVEQGFHFSLVRTVLVLFVAIPIALAVVLVAAAYFWVDRTGGLYDDRSLPFQVVTTMGNIGGGCIMLGVHYRLVSPRGNDDKSKQDHGQSG